MVLSKVSGYLENLFFMQSFRVLGKFPLDNCPPDNSPLDNCAPGNCHLGQLLPEQSPPRTIVPWTIPSDNSDLGLLYCSRIITPGQLLPSAMTITN